MGLEIRPAVPSDFTNDPPSTIIDAQWTPVINGTQVKIYDRYDTDWI